MHYGMRWIPGCERRFCRYCRLLSTLILTTHAQDTLQWQLHHRPPIAQWNGKLGAAREISLNSLLGLWIGYNGSVERLVTPFTRDEGEVELFYRHWLSRRVVLQPRVTGYYFHDVRSLGVSENQRWRALLGIRYQPSWGQFQGELGWEQLRQLKRLDKGISAALHLGWKGRNDIPIAAYLWAEGTLYQGQRRYSNTYGYIAWYSPTGDTLFRGRYRFWLGDFPIPTALTQLQRHWDHMVGGELTLSERLTSRLHWKLWTTAEREQVRQQWEVPGVPGFPTHRLRFNGTAANSLGWDSPIGTFALLFNLRYSEEVNRVIAPATLPEQQFRLQREELRDYSSLWVQSHLAADVGISLNDSLKLQASVSLLRYDTPSAANTDDRDEQHISASLAYTRRWGGILITHAGLEFQGRHTVFLFAPRSAWNHWLYVIAARWTGAWSSSKIAWYPRWGLLASYTVRDYSYTNVLQDLVHRQLEYRDSLVVRIGARGFSEAGVLFRLSSVGLLDWQHFAETPRSRIQELTASCLIGWRSAGQLWALGVQFSRYHYAEPQQGTEQLQESIGPQGRVEFQSAWGTIKIDGWYEWRFAKGQQKGSLLPWLSVSVRRP